jgi:hypothetical protein
VAQDSWIATRGLGDWANLPPGREGLWPGFRVVASGSASGPAGEWDVDIQIPGLQTVRTSAARDLPEDSESLGAAGALS